MILTAQSVLTSGVVLVDATSATMLFSLSAPEVLAFGLPTEVIAMIGQYVPVMLYQGEWVPVVTVSGDYTDEPIGLIGESAPVETVTGEFAETLEMVGAIRGGVL
jgi:hypothetical protein